MALPDRDLTETARDQGGRRATCRAVLALASGAAGFALRPATAAHADPYGAIQPPLALPAVTLRTMEGRRTELRRLLAGRWSAVQLMFTGCSASCPIQGALFADVQRALRKERVDGVQLVSISIDPLGDDPARLTDWLKRFDARPGWIAGVPDLEGSDRLQRFLASPRGGPVDLRPKINGDRHTGQVYLTDRDGRLFWVTADFPSPSEVTRMLRILSERDR